VFSEQMAGGGSGNGQAGNGIGDPSGAQPGAPGDSRSGGGAAGSGQPGAIGSAATGALAGNGTGGANQGAAAGESPNTTSGERESAFSRRGLYSGAKPTQTASSGGNSPGGGSSSSGGPGGGSAQGGQGGTGNSGSSGAQGGQEQGMPSATAHVGARDSMASKRGENWGVPPKAPESVAITRPIRVRCSSTRLEIISENNRVIEGQPIPFGRYTEDSVDALVGRIWQRMEGWGMAGKNLYWHPVLQLEVMPDGEARADDLKTLLAGSGLDISEKSVVSPMASQPGNGRR
jgi:hypothetical protein